VAFLGSPQEVREAIQLAADLRKQALTAPAQEAGMHRSAGTGAGTAAGGSLEERLQCLQQLVAAGALNQVSGTGGTGQAVHEPLSG